MLLQFPLRSRSVPVNELSFVSAYFIWKQVVSMTYVHILTLFYPYDYSHELKEFSPLHTFRITMVTFLPSCLLRQIILPSMFDCGDSCIVCSKQLVKPQLLSTHLPWDNCNLVIYSICLSTQNNTLQSSPRTIGHRTP